MSFDVEPVIRLAALTLGFWILDVVIRRGLAGRVASWQRALGALALVAFAGLFRWERLVEFELVRALALGLAAMLTWKVVTKDIDPAFGEGLVWSRLALIGACAATWFNPAFVLVVLVLLTRPFDQWRHHAILPMRSLLAVAAHVCLAQLGAALGAEVAGYLPDPATLLFFVLTIHASQYFSAGVAKLRLGPKWSSWLLDNRLHYMAANAYAWGWGRFVPWSAYRRLVAATRLGERPLQALSLGLELLAPLALLSREAALLAVLIWSAFHLGVLACGGFWFWDWVGANALLGLAIVLLPESFDAALFGWDSVLAATAFIIALPLQNRLWSPTLLAWWETPLTQRMHWFVEGESGRQYEVYSNYMCPNERLYGKVHACFMAPAPLLTFHLGTVWDPDHRDAIAAAGPDADRLDALRERYGVQPRDPGLAENHINYLHRLFGSLNAGARKHVLPRGLRWLKAPGGHCYYWGELPGYRGQERVVKVSLRFVERYFDGDEIVTLRDELVAELDIDESSAQRACAREPSAREMERLLCEAFWRQADARKPRTVPTIVQQELGSHG